MEKTDKPNLAAAHRDHEEGGLRYWREPAEPILAAGFSLRDERAKLRQIIAALEGHTLALAPDFREAIDALQRADRKLVRLAASWDDGTGCCRRLDPIPPRHGRPGDLVPE